MPVLLNDAPTPIAQVYRARTQAGSGSVLPLASPSLGMPPREWLALFEHLKAWRAQASTDAEINALACHRAVLFAWVRALRGEPVPSRVGLTSNGGVAFEWDEGNRMICIEIHDDVHAEKSVFDGVRLIEDEDLEWSSIERDFQPAGS